MKRISILFLFVLCTVSLVFAQGIRSAPGNQNSGNTPPRVSTEDVTVTGNLTIVQGMIAVKSGQIVYLVPGLMRYTGFIDTLKDGAQVTLEGSAISRRQDNETKILIPKKMTIGGKEYDLAQPRGNAMGWQNYTGTPWPGFGGIFPQSRNPNRSNQRNPGMHHHNRNSGRR